MYDFALRFKARFGGLERSGITLAVVWRTQVRGTRRRRAVKRGLLMVERFSDVFLHCVLVRFWRNLFIENLVTLVKKGIHKKNR